MNVKEDWLIVQYTGENESSTCGLTKDHFYYCPRSKENPVYEGVIDDIGFTSIPYPRSPNSWRVAEYPTGMAARMLEIKSIGSKRTVSLQSSANK